MPPLRVTWRDFHLSARSSTWKRLEVEWWAWPSARSAPNKESSPTTIQPRTILLSRLELKPIGVYADPGHTEIGTSVDERLRSVMHVDAEVVVTRRGHRVGWRRAAEEEACRGQADRSVHQTVGLSAHGRQSWRTTLCGLCVGLTARSPSYTDVQLCPRG